ncbi:D-alanine--D-alanine ligase [Arthrobacter agilis]|uniref:D-alanine--D-alanine ligase family protein n=1 Tax=Arthrobacter agilis TaxID=37921 RepID=UPI000B34D816|nr:D-alanine--D-alanine ligase family protein [Arthrobacter agilis]OUM44241.1 D-alanine--D-alanine ligase A [Arthrobacter agilis]PPB46615.1 D-alanine--D-alanine ligase [Arthrobacter agilis]TPV23726.1 D-alanine--D-alanine ligase [Arthrobacter agilis]VDR32452.1 D-alanine--D-alanine ligase [Arthrobacter agilis]
MTTESPAAPRTRVLVLFGGRSSEHAVSCVTAAGVLEAIDRSRYEVVPVGIAKSGQWSLVSADPSAWSLRADVLPEVTATEHAVVMGTSADGGAGQELLVAAPGSVPESLGGVDVVLPLLHGPFGEDGTLQGMLEMADMRYVGAGVLASAVGMDKHFMKVVFAAAGLEVGPYAVVTDRQWRTDAEGALHRATALGFPLFVKPARAGSSMGISRVEDTAALRTAIEAARAFDPKVVIEAGIEGREIEVAVLQGRGLDAPRTSLPGEIAMQPGDHAWYDFDAKYVDGAAAELTCPADLPSDVIDRVRQLAGEAFEAIGGEGLSRVDFFYTPDGRLVINEINTMPGFTPISMYPQMWAKSGLGYTELIDELIGLALERGTGLR